MVNLTNVKVEHKWFILKYKYQCTNAYLEVWMLNDPTLNPIQVTVV